MLVNLSWIDSQEEVIKIVKKMGVELIEHIYTSEFTFPHLHPWMYLMPSPQTLDYEHTFTLTPGWLSFPRDLLA